MYGKNNLAASAYCLGTDATDMSNRTHREKNAQTPVIQISKNKNNTALIHLFLGRYLSSIILLPHPYPHAEPGGNKIFIPPVTAKMLVLLIHYR